MWHILLIYDIITDKGGDACESIMCILPFEIV